MIKVIKKQLTNQPTNHNDNNKQKAIRARLIVSTQCRFRRVKTVTVLEDVRCLKSPTSGAHLSCNSSSFTLLAFFAFFLESFKQSL